MIVVSLLAGLLHVRGVYSTSCCEPILALADTARAVSDRRDYSVRARPTDGHELGLLTEAFNHMLTQIQEQHGKLNAQLGNLQLLQQTTRAIGERQDLPSLFRVVIASLEESLPIDFGWPGCLLRLDAVSESLTVGAIGAAGGGYAEKLGLTEQPNVPLDSNGLVTLRRRATGLRAGRARGAVSLSTASGAAVGLRSLVIAPLIVENQVFGVLVCARTKEQAFSSGECEFLKQLSEHVALASPSDAALRPLCSKLTTICAKVAAHRS